MNDPSASGYKTRSRTSLQVNRLSTQESSNIKNQHVHSNCTNNAGRKIGQIPSEASTDHAEEVKIVPLSGKPYFSCILTKTSVNEPFHLILSKNSHFLPSSVELCTVTRGKKTWQMKYYGNQPMRRFGLGWRNFAIDNKLKEGDACVFELMDTTDKFLDFRVQILDGQIPIPFDSDAGRGQSLDDPIEID